MGSVIQRIQHLLGKRSTSCRRTASRGFWIVGIEQAWFNGNSAYTEVKDQDSVAVRTHS